MHLCFTAQYTPEALNGILDDPNVNRYEATKKSRRSRRRQVDLDV